MDILNGGIRKIYFQYLLSSIGGAIAVAAYSLVDNIAIGQGVGANGAAAVAVVVPIFCIAQVLALIFGVGGSVLMSRARGERNNSKANAYYTASVLLLAVSVLVVWMLLYIFQMPFYRLFGADDVLMPYVYEYGRWIIWFFPFLVLITFLGCFVRCDGSPKLVMTATLIGAAVNIFGDWFLVFPMKMGMNGAAIATVSGTVIQAVILVSHCFTKKYTLHFEMPFHIGKAFQKIIAGGLGSGLSQFSVLVVSFIANNQIMKYETSDALAIYGMLSTVGSLFMGIYTGIGQAVQPIASVNYGAGKTKRYWQVCKYGFVTALILGTVFCVICELLPMEITRLFMKTNAGIEEIAPYIVSVYSLSFLPLAMNIYIMMYLQCINKMGAASLISVVRGVLLNGILLYALPVFMQGHGIWWAISLAESCVGILAVIYLILLYMNRQKETSLTN